MNQEQKRIKIAEACGWKHYHHDMWVPPNTKDFSELDCDELPDYFNDLDAMREARSTITRDELHRRYLVILAGIVKTRTCSLDWALVDATAAEHAEAFGLTLNLWNK